MHFKRIKFYGYIDRIITIIIYIYSTQSHHEQLKKNSKKTPMQTYAHK